MPIYKHINGTSSQSFKIGLKGVELRTQTTIVDAKNQTKIKKLLIDEKAVLTEDSLLIPRTLVSNWQVDEKNGLCTFFCKYLDENGEWQISKIEVQSANHKEDNNIKISGDSNNILIIDESGTGLKDSGYKILSNILDSDEFEDENTIPTVSAVKAYIGKVEQPLSERIKGLNAKIIEK